MLSSLIAGYWLRMQQKKDPDIFMNLTKAPKEAVAEASPSSESND